MPRVWEWIIWDHLRFNGIRSIIGGIALLPCIFLLNKLNPDGGSEEKGTRKDLILGGVCCGVLLFAASSLQQIEYATYDRRKSRLDHSFLYCTGSGAQKSLKKKTGWKIWTAIAIALVGLYFLCLRNLSGSGKGRCLYLFLCIAFLHAYSCD